MAAALWADEELEAAVGLDGVVTVADARNLARQLDAAREPGAVNEAARQLAYADVVLLNKASARCARIRVTWKPESYQPRI